MIIDFKWNNWTNEQCINWLGLFDSLHLPVNINIHR